MLTYLKTKMTIKDTSQNQILPQKRCYLNLHVSKNRVNRDREKRGERSLFKSWIFVLISQEGTIKIVHKNQANKDFLNRNRTEDSV